MDAMQVQSTSVATYVYPVPSGSTGQNVVVLVRTVGVGSTSKASEDDMTQMNDVLQRLGNVERDVSIVKTDVAGIKERLNHMPTNTQMYSLAGFFLLAAIGVLWWIVQQFLQPILAAIAL